MHRSNLCAGLLLVTSSWCAACGGDRVDVQPGGPGSGAIATTTSASTSGGDGGASGTGGAHGDGGSSSSGAADGGAGGGEPTGAGGQPSWDTCETEAECLGDEPSVCPENACESESIFFTCPGSEESVPAYVACLVAADLFRENVWGRVVDCVRGAPADEHCTEGDAVVTACIAGATADACPNPAADEACAGAASSCEDGDPFPTADCERDLLLFGEEGLARYRACLEDQSSTACSDRHATCLDLILPF